MENNDLQTTTQKTKLITTGIEIRCSGRAKERKKHEFPSKVVIRIRKPKKDIQDTGKMKKDNGSNNDLQNTMHRKSMIEQNEPH